MSERRQAAWDEAQRRYPTGDRQAGFVSGAAWADDNPYSTPEALAAAYEEGQRDAANRGLAKAQPRTIAEAELNEAAMLIADDLPARGTPPAYVLIERALSVLGIEVRSD